MQHGFVGKKLKCSEHYLLGWSLRNLVLQEQTVLTGTGSDQVQSVGG